MKLGSCALLLSLAAASVPAVADDHNPYNVSVSTLITTPLVIEGLTNDNSGNMYAPGRSTTAGQPCPVYKVNIHQPQLKIVGNIPPPATGACSPSGLAFGPDGMLYVTQTDSIYRFTPNEASPPTATLFVSGVPGTNGLAFDWNGFLWTGDGTTGAGRVWMIARDGSSALEMFRIPPMANEVNQAAGGIGRDVRTLPPGTVAINPTSRNASNTLGSQPLVANGLAFDLRGNLYIADTARGAIWKVKVNSASTPIISTGCDTTYTANTLCMDHVFAQHPFLEGVDGIAVDVSGNIWSSVNERNALIYTYAHNGRSVEIFRNPPNAARIRNEGPLESPTSPVLVDFRLCTANSDGNRRDNSPNTAGEIAPAGPNRGKISCIDQGINVPGVRLPVR